MSAARRQMHLGVFVLGTGNHSAGWRCEGAPRRRPPGL
jgi:N-acetyl-S-(2-succino)cysteine monooxygenase